MSASSRREAGSRLDDGSSSTRISGSIASTVATATRRRCPKERWCGGRSANSAIPTCSSASATRAVELGSAQAEVGRAERDVLAHGGHEQLVVGVLEDDPHAAPDLLEVRLLHRQPRDRDRPGTGGEDPVEVQHQRGLAGAVGTEQGDPLAPVDVQVDPEERLVAVGVGVRQPAHVQHGDGHQRSALVGLRVGHRAVVPTGQHREVHPLAALVGADEQRAQRARQDRPVSW